MNAEFVQTAWHEVSLNLVFGDDGDCCVHGLEPFYAADRIVRDSGGSRRASCKVDEWEISLVLYYQDSGIGSLNHPSSDLDTIREFRIKWEVLDEDDDVGQRSGNIHIAPRTPNMTDTNGDQMLERLQETVAKVRSIQDVADRAATTPDVIRRYYDRPDLDEELRRRITDFDGIDVCEHSDPTDINDDIQP